jgi:hypothetical protein
MQACSSRTRRGTPCPFRASQLHRTARIPVCGHHKTSNRLISATVVEPDRESPAEHLEEKRPAGQRPRCAAQTKKGGHCLNYGTRYRQGNLVCGVHIRCTNLVLYEVGQQRAPGPTPFEDTEEECRICFEPFEGTRVTTLPCGHRFCQPCSRQHRRTSVGRNHRCPACRTPVVN